MNSGIWNFPRILVKIGNWLILGHAWSNHHCFVRHLGYIFFYQLGLKTFGLLKQWLWKLCLSDWNTFQFLQDLKFQEFCVLCLLINSLVSWADSIFGFGCKNWDFFAILFVVKDEVCKQGISEKGSSFVQFVVVGGSVASSTFLEADSISFMWYL